MFLNPKACHEAENRQPTRRMWQGSQAELTRPGAESSATLELGLRPDIVPARNEQAEVPVSSELADTIVSTLAETRRRATRRRRWEQPRTEHPHGEHDGARQRGNRRG